MSTVKMSKAINVDKRNVDNCKCQIFYHNTEYRHSRTRQRINELRYPAHSHPHLTHVYQNFTQLIINKSQFKLVTFLIVDILYCRHFALSTYAYRHFTVDILLLSLKKICTTNLTKCGVFLIKVHPVWSQTNADRISFQYEKE